MINTTELRIGNWILDTEEAPHYFQVEEIRKYVGYELWAYYRKGSIKSKSPEPIPLSEEILLKCGFEKSSEYWYAIKFKVYTEMGGTQINELSINPEIGKCNIEFVGYIGAPMKGDSGVLLSDYQTRYLHQLQNLYFALTGEELTINI